MFDSLSTEGHPVQLYTYNLYAYILISFTAKKNNELSLIISVIRVRLCLIT